MTAAFRSFLGRWPRLHAGARAGYYGAWRVLEQTFGTRVQELRWKLHPGYDLSDEHPHRAFLANRIARFAPLESLLEIGCGEGSNLTVLGRAFPQTRLIGIDIGERALARARTNLARELPGRPTELIAGTLDALSGFATKSVDVVLSDAVLMYVGPDQIRSVLRALVRVSRGRVLLNEWHLFGATAGCTSRFWNAHWLHDYEALLQDMPVRTVCTERLPAGLFGAGGWQRWGALIEIEP